MWVHFFPLKEMNICGFFNTLQYILMKWLSWTIQQSGIFIFDSIFSFSTIKNILKQIRFFFPVARDEFENSVEIAFFEQLLSVIRRLLFSLSIMLLHLSTKKFPFLVNVLSWESRIVNQDDNRKKCCFLLLTSSA